jgi:hypothetical protein
MPSRDGRIRWRFWVALTLSIFLSLYLASPLIALYDIASAIEDRDAVALTERIDFPAVRRSLRKQIVSFFQQLWLNSEYRGRSFYVYLPPKKSRADQFRAHLRLIQWRWHIVGLDLPGDLKQHLAQEVVKLTEDRLRPEGSQ